VAFAAAAAVLVTLDRAGAGPASTPAARIATLPAGGAPAREVARVRAEVAERMPELAPGMRLALADVIVAEARRAGLDPMLVLAVIHVESSFDHDVTSSAGAVGLMQLLEPTMRRELQRNRLPAADPRDPVANVRAGVRYLQRLVAAFRGDFDLALMAYNAGPNRILGHLRAGGVPERFHGYPRKVRAEAERLRRTAEGQRIAELAALDGDAG
jgi:soluble lytic murein transglycosylase-like protein